MCCVDEVRRKVERRTQEVVVESEFQEGKKRRSKGELGPSGCSGVAWVFRALQLQLWRMGESGLQGIRTCTCTCTGAGTGTGASDMAIIYNKGDKGSRICQNLQAKTD